MPAEPGSSGDARCPICGEGLLAALGTEDGAALQGPRSRILETYACGHEVAGPTLASADADALEVERRDATDSVDPAEEPSEVHVVRPAGSPGGRG
jgi:hypothetical protein